MSKYIDADLLRKEIEKHIKEVKDAAERFTPNLGFFDAKLSGIYDVMAIIDSLQQDQLPGIEEHGVPGKDFIPVEWVDACEKYGKWKIVQQEQPSLPDNLDEAAKEYMKKARKHLFDNSPIGRADDAFKAGAKWMAGQGLISEGIIYQTSREDTTIELNEHIGYLEDCEKVIVNIRKKEENHD